MESETGLRAAAGGSEWRKLYELFGCFGPCKRVHRPVLQSLSGVQRRGLQKPDPGPGAKGVGDTAIRNYNKWAEIRVNMDTLCGGGRPDTSLELFGRRFRYPVLCGSGRRSEPALFGYVYTDTTYNEVLVQACAQGGIAAFTGDGVNPDVMTQATRAITRAGGCGVPTVKPWNMETIRAKMEQVKASGCFAVAMDVDAAGLPFLKNMDPPAGCKSVEELRQIVEMAQRPFIVKGVMTVAGALKAQQAGAAGIVVSNHGGRVLDQCPSTAEVLPRITALLKGSGVKLLVDGGLVRGWISSKHWPWVQASAQSAVHSSPLFMAVMRRACSATSINWQGSWKTPCRCAVPTLWHNHPDMVGDKKAASAVPKKGQQTPFLHRVTGS